MINGECGVWNATKWNEKPDIAIQLSPLWRRSRHRGGSGVLNWICGVWYPGGRGSYGVAGAGTGGMPNGTFQIRFIFVKVAAKQRNSFPLSPQGRLADSVVASGHNVLLELLRIYSI